MDRPLRRRQKPISSFLDRNAHCLLTLSTYILLLLAKRIDTAMLNRENEYLSVVLLQILVFLIPALLFCKLRGNAFTAKLRLSLPRPSQILLLLSAFLLLVSGCLLLSIQTGGIETLSENFTLYDIFLSKNDGTFSDILYLLLAYAALPALCEELVFRGILCASLEERGLFCAVAYSAFSFGMLHFQIRQLPAYIFAGALLCLCLYATRSLLAAILLHFAYNVFCLFGQPALTQFYLYTGSTRLFTFLLVCVFLIALIIFCGEAGRVYRSYSRAALPAPYRVIIPRGELPGLFLRTLFPPVGIVAIVFYIFVCIFQ